MLLGFGLNYLYMKPLPEANSRNFSINFPGIYFRAGGEYFVNDTRFIHSEMYMSINKGSMDNGFIKTSRLNYNYGIGWDYRVFKWSLNPGFCFVSVAYQDNISTKTITETRFAPSAGLQFDLMLLDKNRQYLSLFTEAGVMISLNSKWVNQLATGINWKPSFSKPKKEPVSPL